MNVWENSQPYSNHAEDGQERRKAARLVNFDDFEQQLNRRRQNEDIFLSDDDTMPWF
jgi:hypothetical protein